MGSKSSRYDLYDWATHVLQCEYNEMQWRNPEQIFMKIHLSSDCALQHGHMKSNR